MAAIKIRDGVAWVGAAWVLRSIARRVQAYGNFPSLAEQFPTIEAGWQFLDLSNLARDEREELRKVIPLIVRDIKESGPTLLSNPEFYPGLLAAYEEFENMLNGDNLT